MTVRRKLLLTLSAFIVGMGIVFILLTFTVVWGILYTVLDTDRVPELDEWSSRLAEFYDQNGRAWDGVEQWMSSSVRTGAELMLQSPDRQVLYHSENADTEKIRWMGKRSTIESGGRTVAYLYYYDPQLGSFYKTRIGIISSVMTLLIAGAVVFILIALLAASRMARIMTSPLDRLMDGINRFANGQFGVQIPMQRKDEYGKVADAFNVMSAQIQQTERSRRKLTADIAHELRTPITVISGKLEWLQQQNEPVEPHELLPLQDELIRLSRLVDDLHQLSMAEARKLPLNRSQMNILDLVRQAVEHVRPSAEQKHITMTIDAEPLDSDKSTVCVDRDRIMQVFYNLLVNAIRYTPDGGRIQTSVERMEAGSGTPAIRIRVTDNGIGIEPEHLPNLFDRFYRTDDARHRSSGGSGLGLAIAKELVLQHGGSIEVDSAPGKGSTFSVLLPVSP